MTSATWYPSSGTISNVTAPPASTVWASGGVICPWAPGVGVMVWYTSVSGSNVAESVWSACTFVNS